MSKPLSGIIVLDMTWALAGPYATMVLADLGARVLKVERPGQGDFTRGNGPFVDGVSTYFASVNRGKESVTVNLKHPEGKRIVRELARRADVLVENFVPGTMERLGLGSDDLRAVNPRLIYASCSGFGQTGPYREKPALDMIIQAMAGTLSITGEPGGPPVRPGFSIGDIGASLFLVAGILAALVERERSGTGQIIDVGMLDSQVALLENAFARYLATGELPGPIGSRHPVVTPFRVFHAKDTYMVVAVGNEGQWQALCRVLGRSDLAGDGRFASNELRTTHRETLEPILEEILHGRTVAEWLALLEEAGVPCSRINTVADAARDPQVAARGVIVPVPHPGAGDLRLVNTPIKFSRTPSGIAGPSPALGQHTEKILREFLGLTAEESEALSAAGAI